MANLGTVPGDPDETLVSTTDPDKVTLWLGAAGATDLTRRDAEELAALLLRAVRQFGGCPDHLRRRAATRARPRPPLGGQAHRRPQRGPHSHAHTPVASSGFPCCAGC